MSTWQPKPGEKFLMTVHAKVLADGYYAVPLQRYGDMLVFSGDSAIVRVEPVPVELPTGFCARIEATVDGHRGVRLGLSDPGDSLPWRVHADDLSRVGAIWYADDDLSDIVVLDPGEVPS